MDERTKTIVEALRKAETLFRLALSDNEIDLYLEAFSDIAPQAVVDAVNEYIRIGKRFPFPADLRELVKGESS